MNAASADPGQDPRGAPDLMPLWTILDVTPEGRGTDWYLEKKSTESGVTGTRLAGKRVHLPCPTSART